MLLGGIVLVGVAFTVPEAIAGYIVIVGIILIGAAVAFPVWLLDKLDG